MTLENSKEVEEKVETNQGVIRIKCVFRGFIVKNWTSTNFETVAKYISTN